MGGIIYLSQTAWLKYLGQLQFSRFFFLLFLVFISCPGKAMVLSSLISVFSIKKGANLHYIEKYSGTGGSGIPECWQLWVQCGGATFLSCPASSTWQREWFKQQLEKVLLYRQGNLTKRQISLFTLWHKAYLLIQVVWCFFFPIHICIGPKLIVILYVNMQHH